MNRVLALCAALLVLACVLLNAGISSSRADDLQKWQFYADTQVHPQADDTFSSVYADFTRLFKRDLKMEGVLDEGSIRVVPLENDRAGVPVPSRFIKAAGYNAASNAEGTLVFLVRAAPEPGARTYRIFFDTQKNGPKPILKTETEVPAAANMVWNGSFEITAENYTGSHRYKNSGAKMPVGWWGNLRNRKITENPAATVRSGKNALAFVVPEGRRNTGILVAPSPPGLRVRPGHSYHFSFWATGEGLEPIPTILLGSVYWYDKEQKNLRRDSIGGLPKNVTDFPWLRGEGVLTVPLDAHYAALSIATYSTTGLITVDDLEVCPIVPPLLENAKENR